MGRHSRKGSGATRPDATAAEPGGERAAAHPASGNGRRRRTAPAPTADGRNLFSPLTGDGQGPFPPDAPQVRGGHPEQHEKGGGWGGTWSTGAQPRYGQGPGASASPGAPHPQAPHQHPGPDGRPGDARPSPDGPGGSAGSFESDDAAARQQAVARQVSAQRAAQRAADGRAAQQQPAGPPVPGPRQEFLEAFDTEAPGTASAPSAGSPDGPDGPDGTGAAEPEEQAVPRGSKGRTFTGIAAAAVTTVLAVVVAGQVAEDSGGRAAAARAAEVDRQGLGDEASRSDARPTPEQPARKPEVKPLSYGAKMAQPYPLAADLKATGEFEAVPGLAKAPGKGQKHRYRIDVEKGLGLDAGLFAEAVQKTLNDDRSWAHNGAMTFERISSGQPDFVITLASPGTTGDWCAKSGLDTTVDNVSCDSASTDRVMINAYRWAQGAATFGPDKLLPYRQMLINHEVGHRLGYNHVSCRTPGALAPVMQQQTKTLELEGIKCKPNPWVHPKG
ncbi:hypothetical protein WQO_23740 [Streptomyces globisporus C-1027]|uniref:DUF3152 domain-containing protein n=1 Tax=Streptomyces globisporus C-1027 TaxID=1172567 RepID=A0A0U3C2T5_STRGL|nr:DUF3152 domain-containing protein [Streptomyces globisporus]ALU96069.1 hypothetical protein WQO_23740 [Streptomyces globisporus C-1027]